jgi:hypothetical protein
LDAKTWKFRPSPADDGQILAICWTGERFVAVGNLSDAEHIIMTSRDGIKWVQRDTAVDGIDPTLIAVASDGDGKVVAVGVGFHKWDPRLILVSTDHGTSWTQRLGDAFPPNFDDTDPPHSVEWVPDPDGFTGDQPNCTIVILPPRLPDFPGLDPSDGQFGDPEVFVGFPIAVRAPGVGIPFPSIMQWLATITDSGLSDNVVEVVAWLYVPSTNTYGGVRLGGSDLVLHVSMALSYDGMGAFPPVGNVTLVEDTWVKVYTQLDNTGADPLSSGTELTVKMSAFLTGDDTSQFDEGDVIYMLAGLDHFAEPQLLSVAHGGSVWLATTLTSTGATLLRSTSPAAIWSEVDGTPLDDPGPRAGGAFAIAYGNGKWVAGGMTHESDTVIMTSDDGGVSWDAQTTPVDGSYVQDVTYAAGIFVAATGSDPPIISSVDGETWIGHSSDVLGTDGTFVVRFGPLGLTGAPVGSFTVIPRSRIFTTRML